MRLATVSAAVLLLAITTADAEEYRVVGRVVGADGEPVERAMVSAFWRANGSPKTPEGKDYDLADADQNAAFWGNVGDMQPWQTPVETAADGAFEISLPDRNRHLFAMDASRTRGGIVEIPRPAIGTKIEIRLGPLVIVRGQMKSVVAAKPVSWSHVYVELNVDPTNPLAMRRVVSCGSHDGRFQFGLPHGTYRLDAYGISESDVGETDLRVTPSPVLTIDGKQQEIDMGTLELALAQADRQALEKSAKDGGRWRDYTMHYGEPAPEWHVVDTRGITTQTKIKDFRGKWLMIDFWGLSCAPCLANGVPKMMEFYEQHADKRDRFEIIGVCIDIHGEIKDMKDLDTALAPIVTHVWKGRRIEFPIILDNTFRTWERYGIPGLGTVVLVDPDGNLVEGDASTLNRILD